MSPQRFVPACLLMLLLLASGCRWTGWHHAFQSAAAEPDPTMSSAHREGSGVHPVQQASSQQATSSHASQPRPTGIPEFTAITPVDTTHPPMDDTVLRELQIISASDPVAAQQLMAQLQEVKPTLRPLVAQQFRSSWQYHRQLTGNAIDTPTTPISAAIQAPAPLPAVDPQPAAPPAETPAASPPPASEAPAAPQAEAAPKPEIEAKLASHEEPLADSATETAKEEVASATTGDSLLAWRDSVDMAIKQLEEVTPPEPRSTHEAYQFSRLRLLQLIAGNGQAPMSPIPGLTPTEQGYWSSQLFALTTMLDHTTHADDQQRAALARSQLQEADRKLGEISQLSILNLSFCTKVLAYGNYVPLEKTAFRPGQAVRLYAELENFRSDSTEKGYHTSLATSYEVLDKNGDRVAQGEFATIDDYCLRRRRDFYMEFALDLPARVYASSYTLQIQVRDRLSGKLAKSSVPFTIAD